MSVQRRRGQIALIYREKELVDEDGNRTLVPDLEGDPHRVRVHCTPNRGSRGEVPGQLPINVFDMRFPAELEGVGLFSRVYWDGKWWDPVTPPQRHFGIRRTRHDTWEIRERPHG